MTVALGMGGLVGTAAAATAPPNDRISGATIVTALPFTQTLNTRGATTDAKDAQLNQLCGAPATNNSVWYKFTAGPGDTVLTVDTAGSSFSSGVIIASGTPNALALQICSPVSTQVATVSGTTYFVLVFDDSGSGGTLKLSIHGPGAPPANDKFGAAQAIKSLPFSQASLDTTGATTDAVDQRANETCGAPGTDHSVWFKYTAGPKDSSFFVDTSASSYPAGVLVATGTRDSLTTVTCGPTKVIAPVTPGQTYYILVFDFSGGIGGILNLAMDRAPTFDTTVRYNTVVYSSGSVRLKGTYTCTRGGVDPIIDVAGQLVQISGRTVITGFFDTGITPAHCNGESHVWSAIGVPDSAKFVPGPAAAITSDMLCTLSICVQNNQSAVVNLETGTTSTSAAAPLTSATSRTFVHSARKSYGAATHAGTATWGH